MKRLEAELKIVSSQFSEHEGTGISVFRDLTGDSAEDVKRIIAFNEEIEGFVSGKGRVYAQGAINHAEFMNATEQISETYNLKKTAVFEGDGIHDIRAGAFVLDAAADKDNHVKIIEGEPNDEAGKALILMDFYGQVNSLPLHTHSTSRVLSIIEGEGVGYHNVQHTNTSDSRSVLSVLQSGPLVAGSIVAYPADVLHTFSAHNKEKVMRVATYHGAKNGQWVSFDDSRQYNPEFPRGYKIYPGKQSEEQIMR